MINLTKSQLVESAAKVLGHQWSSGGFWTPCTDKLESLCTATSDQLARMNRASLYGLLNFYREYLPTFAEMTEPIRELLSQDARPWTEAQGYYVLPCASVCESAFGPSPAGRAWRSRRPIAAHPQVPCNTIVFRMAKG